MSFGGLDVGAGRVAVISGYIVAAGLKGNVPSEFPLHMNECAEAHYPLLELEYALGRRGEIVKSLHCLCKGSTLALAVC